MWNCGENNSESMVDYFRTESKRWRNRKLMLYLIFNLKSKPTKKRKN